MTHGIGINLFSYRDNLSLEPSESVYDLPRAHPEAVSRFTPAAISLVCRRSSFLEL
jgi:hypothetical protein